jgi:WD40 repeat protein
VVGGKKYSYLFSIVNYNLTSKIEIDSQCYSICCLSDGTILTGHENGYIKQWNLNNNELKLIGEKKVHDDEIRVISQLKNDLILSGSCDKKINIYKIQ